MKRTLLIALTITAFSGGMIDPAKAVVIAGWNFNTDTNATAGSGTFSTNFPSTTTIATGTTLGAINSDPAGTALELDSGASGLNNGLYIQFNINMTGLQNLALTYATLSTNNGFNSEQISYSIDGTTFTNFGSAIVPTTLFTLQTVDLSSVTALNSAASVNIRMTFAGAINNSGKTDIDNVVLATVPEPHEWGIMMGGLLGVMVLIRRRQNARMAS